MDIVYSNYRYIKQNNEPLKKSYSPKYRIGMK